MLFLGLMVVYGTWLVLSYLHLVGCGVGWWKIMKDSLGVTIKLFSCSILTFGWCYILLVCLVGGCSFSLGSLIIFVHVVACEAGTLGGSMILGGVV